ncbi:MAG TPA: hypothetical protein VGU64_17030, partial [Terriglobales bacterium]|nr:hypothetical protein [Terriglobales bacterium]
LLATHGRTIIWVIREQANNDVRLPLKADIAGAAGMSALGQVQTLGRFRKCGIMELRMRNPKLDFEDQAMEVLP